MLDIKDKPGAISKALMRHYFEGAINNTTALKGRTPLGPVTVNGEFSHYADSGTDTMWLGFALGMRCAERVQAAVDAQNAGRSVDACYCRHGVALGTACAECESETPNVVVSRCHAKVCK